MECPNCKKDGAIQVHTDPIQCTDCCSTMEIGYCVCTECEYTFRTNNDEFMDGVSIDDALDDLLKSMEESMMKEEEYSMSALLHNCIKCNSLQVSKSKNKYSCAACDFSWEILNNG